MKILSGQLEPDSGKVEIGETVKTGFFTQENTDMDQNLRVIEYIRTVAEHIETANGSLSASQMLERFLFPPSVQWTPISKLSGGEKRRLYLLSILMSAPNILLLDEPTNDLDIQTLTILEAYLDEFPGAVITVSHDRYFLDRTANRIFSFEGNGEIIKYAGNYSDYREYMNLRGKSDNTDKAASPDKRNNSSQNKTEWQKNKEKPLKFTFKEQKEFEEIDDVIAALESDLEKVKKDIDKSATDFTKLQELLEKQQELEKELDLKMERWTYLYELAEKIENSKKK